MSNSSGIKQNMQAGKFHAVCYRQHRDFDFGVFFASGDRQRPEMRRCPDENDQKQQQRIRMHFAGHRAPAQQRRSRSDSAADNDVLRRHPFEVDRINNRVTDR